MTTITQFIHGVQSVKLTEMHYDDFRTLRINIKTEDSNVEISLFTDNGLPPSFEFAHNYMEKKNESEKV